MTIHHIIDIAHHRNGICAAPFHAVLFKSKEQPKRTMLGIAFDAKDHVAVFDIEKLKQRNIRFGENSYRGDVYEAALRSAINNDQQGEST